MTKQCKARASGRYVIGTALAVSLAALAGTANAVPGYVTSQERGAVTDSAGHCWRTGEWSPVLAAAPCDAVPRAATPVAPVAVTQEPAPVAAAPEPQVIQKLTLSTDVLFPFNKAELLPGGKRKLDDLANTAQGADVDSVKVIGNADRIGSEQYNQKLSEQRAQAVKEYIAQKGVSEDRVQAEGRGESQPVTGDQCQRMGPEKASNRKLVSCLQPDRRVEIEVLGQRQAASAGAPGAASTGSGTGSSSTSSSGTSGAGR
ncbi:MAG TPA: OmpA family protein [Burkholderiales bacterium]|nr:OmpA family protein [Burkholderiales bacterium]